MSKKTWIKIKRGLILDPKHRMKMGINSWLYQYMLDQTNWDTGQIGEWVDRHAADDMQMPLPTLRKQRKQLEEDGYISCIQKKHHQTITIHNWTNPREYSGKVYNKKNKGNQQRTPSKKAKGNRKGDHEGNHKDDHKVIGGVDTPTSNSQATNHTSQNQVVVNRDSIIRALFEAGIEGEKIQQQLSGLKHMTPEYIKAHAYKAKREDVGLGLLIHKLKSRDPMPKNGGHQDGCNCADCRSRYITGEFADSIEH